MNWSRYSFSFFNSSLHFDSISLISFWLVDCNQFGSASHGCSICYSIKSRNAVAVAPISRLISPLFIHFAAPAPKVYHVCALEKKFSFLCPNGTIFDQRVFVCRWWHNVDCASSANYYNLNDLIGISPPTQQPAVKNPIHFPSAASYGPAAAAAPTKLVVQQQLQSVSQKPLKQIYGPPPSSAVLQPVLIEEAIRRPSSGLKAPALQPTASSAY